MADALQELGTMISVRQEEAIIDTQVAHGELAVTVGPATIAKFIAFLKSDAACQFTTLIDVTAVDYPEREKRFDVVYHLLSMTQNQRIRVKVAVREDEIVPSITEIHPSANWFEREVFDMYGVMFSGHPDLRRILTDYGFIGHPFRKDFPLIGNVEVSYDADKGRVAYQPVSIEPRTLVPRVIRDDNRYSADLKDRADG